MSTCKARQFEGHSNHAIRSACPYFCGGHLCGCCHCTLVSRLRGTETITYAALGLSIGKVHSCLGYITRIISKEVICNQQCDASCVAVASTGDNNPRGTELIYWKGPPCDEERMGMHGKFWCRYITGITSQEDRDL